MEHCGDDYLTALAESVQDTEEWDDIHAMESEACGALSNMFGRDIPHGVEADNDGDNINMVEDSPEREEYPNFMVLDSSDSEELEFRTPMRKKVGSNPSSVVRPSSLLVSWLYRL